MSTLWGGRQRSLLNHFALGKISSLPFALGKNSSLHFCIGEDFFSTILRWGRYFLFHFSLGVWVPKPPSIFPYHWFGSHYTPLMSRTIVKIHKTTMMSWKWIHQPGNTGGAWTSEEVDIVRRKVKTRIMTIDNDLIQRCWSYSTKRTTTGNTRKELSLQKEHSQNGRWWKFLQHSHQFLNLNKKRVAKY